MHKISASKESSGHQLSRLMVAVYLARTPVLGC